MKTLSFSNSMTDVGAWPAWLWILPAPTPIVLQLQSAMPVPGIPIFRLPLLNSLPLSNPCQGDGTTFFFSEEESAGRRPQFSVPPPQSSLGVPCMVPRSSPLDRPRLAFPNFFNSPPQRPSVPPRFRVELPCADPSPPECDFSLHPSQHWSHLAEDREIKVLFCGGRVVPRSLFLKFSDPFFRSNAAKS